MVRPGFAGSQRLGWTTTGDSVPTYANFRAHTRAMLNLTLSGFSNVGQDIGGWDGKSSDPLYARWFAAATFYPSCGRTVRAIMNPTPTARRSRARHGRS
jgi:Alpha-glucosidases, family 31 of glycosyl hydrolases